MLHYILVKNITMKRVSMFIVLLLSVSGIFAQQLHFASTAAQSVSYRKPANKSSASRVLLIGGIGLVAAGIVSYLAESDDSYYPGKAVGTGLMIGGGAAIITALVLRNSDGSSSKLIGMKMETVASGKQVKNYLPVQRLHYPALSFQLAIGKSQ